MTIRLMICAALALLVAACATDKPLETGCARLAEFQFPPPVQASITATALAKPSDPLSRAFTASSASLRRADVSASASDALILSGGGEWGAYGAGFLRGWSGRGRLPARVTTGVSTGALQATFAYLGPTQDQALVDAYAIPEEAVLINRHGSAFFLTHASMADTAPLKTYIRERVGPRLDDVRTEYLASGRVLLVGAVDGLSGTFHYFDLTAMAAALDGPERLDCYTAALIASAAVPVVFRQATINGRPWLDGGVRYSVFLPDLVKQIAAAKASARAQGPIVETDGRVHAIMNGPMTPEAVAELPARLLPTIGRLRSIVFNQVEQASLDLSAAYARRAGLRLFATTADGWDTAELPECVGQAPGRDDQIFDPAFMRCLIAYGGARWTAGGDPWVEQNGP